MSDCRYCKDITVCAICGKGYAEAVRAPCTVCGTSYMEHGSYPTCASHPYSADGRCGHVGTFADGKFTGEPCAGAECKNGCVRAVETKTYSDGTTATGSAPLPMQSPTQQEHVAGLVEDYGQWMWDAGYMDDPRGEALVDDAAQRRKEIRDAVDAAQQHAYAEGRKDQATETFTFSGATLVKRFELALERFHGAYADPYADAEDRGDAKRKLADAREALLAVLAKATGA